MPDDPEATQALSDDPNRTQFAPAPSINATQTIQPVQCPVCKTFNPAGEAFCIECGLLFASALPEDAFGAPAIRPPCLVDESGREHFLRPGANIVGREGDILLPDARISRRHAEVTLQDGTVTLKDLGSTNGTQVNGERVEPEMTVELNPGDKVEFGGLGLTLSFPGESRATQAAASHQSQTLAAPHPETPAAFLTSEDGEFPLQAGANSFGRRPTNDVILDDPYVSGAHGRIDVEDDGIYLTDLGSTNGTYLNGARIASNQRVKVEPDDEIRLGQRTFVLRSSEEGDGVH